MALNLQIPQKKNLKPTITVFGVGGAGGNAVNNMIVSKLEGVNFVVANTDSQAIDESPCANKIQLGVNITQGLGAGSYPEVGKAAAEESHDEILDFVQGSNLVFVTAGLGGGTGTGAAPVVARIAREQGILTVGVVTKPFHFEGPKKMRVAELGLQEMQKYVDTLIVIPNQNLFRIADKNTSYLDSFRIADSVLKSGIKSITDLMTMPGYINIDFADVRAIMGEMGKAMLGTGEADGENRAIKAAEAAISNPLLDNVSMKGAKGVLINITGGEDMTLFEVDEAANRIREEVDEDANIIFGSTFDKDANGKIRVSVVATGIDSDVARKSAESVMKPRIEPAINRVEEDEDEYTSQNVFVSKEPIEPEVRNAGFTRSSSSEARAPRKEAEVSGGLFGSLFSRKETPHKIEHDSPSAASYGNVELSEKPSEKTNEDLEIPAFLRRKG
jgi:cell division protein FtsZ